MKKLIALVLALALVLMVGAAFAANHSISVASGSTRTYDIYQIFTGDVDTTTANQLNNIKYGANTSAGHTVGAYLSQEDIETLQALADGTGSAGDRDDIDSMAAFVDLSGTAFASASDGNPASVPDGYYLVKETTSLSGEETATLYLMKVVGADITITPKVGIPDSDKEIGALGSGVKTGDYNIGDTIPYTISAVLPANYAAYKEYYFKFVDDIAPGLTLVTNSVQIKYGSGDASAITFTDNGDSTVHTGGKNYSFTTPDLVTTHPELVAGDTISITYNAILNDSAVVADAGNPNTFHIEFSNDPNKTGNGTPGTGPDHVVIVFTFKTVFDKLDDNNNALAGADFELYKLTGSDQSNDNDWTIVTSLHTGTGALNPSKTRDAGADDSTTFTFSGLGQGTYKLVETQVPTGYNGIDPIIFTVSATYSISSNPHISALTGTGSAITMTRNNTNKAELDANIVNHSGVVLPSTGGIGTTIFYILGGLLVVGAAVILVARRKASN